MMEVIEVLVFVGKAEVQRTSEIFRQCVLRDVIDLEEPVTCADCGAEDLALVQQSDLG
jgi:hypothetical protein